jgi:microcin C transport system permease protein
MFHYILKRLLLIIPTLFVIVVINFLIVQLAPGGPVENMVARLSGFNQNGGGDSVAATSSQVGRYKASQGLDPEMLENIKKLYGFDKPAHERLWLMLKNYATFELGESYFRNTKVIDLIIEKLPVSITLGLWSTLLIYLISIPLGIHKAVKNGQSFDTWTSMIIIVAFAIPSFLFAIILITVFGGNGPLGIFPTRGITSYHWETFSTMGKITDYLWHITLPVIAITISGFATITMLTKNSFLEEINKQYVVTARAKGVAETGIRYGHIFRNAMLIVISGMPDAIIKVLFTGALLIEIIFSLDGLGLLSYECAISRDYPVVFGTLFIFTLIGLVVNLITDMVYVLVDPRINFESNQI